MHANGADTKVRGKAHNVLDRAPCETKEDFNPLTPNGLSDQCTPLNLSHMTPPRFVSDVCALPSTPCRLFPIPEKVARRSSLVSGWRWRNRVQARPRVTLRADSQITSWTLRSSRS